ncbi:hypothetical protein BLS_003328 [Venturia inaequalis]|uniref:Signal recognition particle receptor subunit beta n=1 Tax=Venturia inaequalis TaxID=5025 RepID=A0A8H3YYX3_VENIN|nr:hypothetical protein BLS_003328 [Venturia inaequalis]KAE9994299.1 hypothetical protein EG327_011401 [Venturia inaequalis]
MAWYDEDSWVTAAFAANHSTILVTVFLALALPILVHLYIYRSRASTSTPTFLVLGPSGSGKTSLVTKLERGTPAQTHTSVDPLSILAVLPSTIRPASAKYRSSHDDASLAPIPILLKDTPGHAKLRHHADTLLETSPKGIIFVVDSTALSSSTTDGEPNKSLSETAEYLHDTLLSLQRRFANAGSSKIREETSFLVAANKLDLFTSLPPNVVKATLENEITKIRDTRAKGLLSVGTVGKGEGLGSTEEEEPDEEKDVLGGTSEGKFSFDQMREWNLEVVCKGGNVIGDEGPGVDGWWEWIAEQI